MDIPAVSLVLAGHNEGDILKRQLTRCKTALSQAFTTYEIIYVDDGSTDDSVQIVEELARNDAHIRLLRNYVNLNFGASVLRGLVAAQYEYVVYNAVDLPLPPEDMAEIIAGMEQCDLMVLQRDNYKSTVFRKIASVINQALLHVLFPGGMKGNPVVNYIQVFRRQVIPQILPLARSPIFVWPEMIFRAKSQGLRVQNRVAPCVVENVRKGAFGKPHIIIWGICDMLRYRIRKWRGR